ncbi:ABC transporter ATP-binding protein [Mammaliicoccus lentus]|uniref:ABC transporter ATP-binding protein n=1 Tax=Mammaliicoccus lentus TaxID=42858 RepID=UPI000CD09D6D|nr:ABC transporter ATP-binding protein [Mammaliicoccus lentus]POA03723.1 ABC transporter [Mammaliicoccus lentus]WQK50221.1 ABC transporter ATP-binding protein [Mammaliicoccus lentus]SUM50698.1 cobalt ABC transporter ATPase [Mammaliicoccus lentus]HBV04357.1 ABC transporter [Staphylococcus sp.]
MIQLKNISFTYENGDQGIRDINLNIKKGEVVCLTGPSGCGKTTVTRLFNGLIPHFFKGEIDGEALINGDNIQEETIYDIARHSGSVFQNPRSQFFCLNTTSELAFEAENYEMPSSKIKQRIQDVTESFHLQRLLDRDIFNLSGGEKQLIACIGVTVCQHDLIVLDEPSSNLDFITVSKLRKMIDKWKVAGKTVVIAEHRLYYLLGIVDRFVVLNNGTIENIYSCDEFSAMRNEQIQQLGLRATHLNELTQQHRSLTDHNQSYISLRHFQFRYHRKAPLSLDIDCLDLKEGQITAIIGRNGAGKSTLARCLSGIERKFKGEIKHHDKTYKNKGRIEKVYMVFQDVNCQLFAESVENELLISNKTLSDAEIKTQLTTFDIAKDRERHPLALSGGEKQRLAIASGVVTEREILIFDEPTSGLDGKHMQDVAQTLKELTNKGRTVLLITHDYELILESADDILRIDNGQVAEQYTLTEETLPRLKQFFEFT